jgi:hypothetical protein
VSLSSDGKRLAIGAMFNDGNGSNSGHVRVYDWSSNQWTQVGNDIDGEAADDLFGGSMSLSSDGNIIAISAIENDGNGDGSGHVRVFELSSDQWTQVGNDIDGEAPGDKSGYGFGVSLSSDGNILAIGAAFNDGSSPCSGHVRVYERSYNQWTQVGNDIDGEAFLDISGYSVSLSSDGIILAIGAMGVDGENGVNSGRVRVYERSYNQWTQVGNDIDGEAALDNSGYSVSLSSNGNTVAIGAYGNDGNGTESGHVRVYKLDISDQWTQVGDDIDGEAAEDLSGVVSLSSDGNILAVGATGNDGNGINSGHVRVYKLNILDQWIQVGNDIDGEAAEDYAGLHISLSSDGKILAIGAGNNDGNVIESGHARVFEWLCSN